MMDFVDRSKITEEPVPRCTKCRLKPCEICCYRPSIKPTVFAETTQAEQREGKFSLRRMK